VIGHLQLNAVTFLSVCLILLVLIGISFLLTYLTGPQGVPPKTIENAENLIAPSVTDDSIIIGEPPIATIDINTGDVELHGKPNDAALMFWEAVEEMKP